MTAANTVMTDQDFAEAKTLFGEGSFSDKVVLVSGGGSGIGKATAWLLARLGAKVIIIGRTEPKLAACCQAITAAGYRAEYHVQDIRDYDGIAAMFAKVFDKYGRLDALINNAGGQFPQPAIEFSKNGFDAVVGNNLNGSWYMMQQAARQWRERKQSAVIVNVVAVVSRGMAGGAHTCAARAGVIHLSKTVAVEWAEYGIRVNCVAPGVIFSEGMGVYSDEARSAFDRSNPMKRFGTPWEIAQSCAFLASEAAGFVTGEVLTVDGGGQLWGDLWMAGKPDYFS
ncbi:MAG: citronellol/citronellal dehydrogenase [Zhongshania aliphaticivorans]|jgi:citronellol/citronellal dehydrogenase|uniref:SDR family oxidoreductase n=1 Tax=Zhongshania aliphaticivorans TaxID=1470434 RepID=UPI0039E6C031